MRERKISALRQLLTQRERHLLSSTQSIMKAGKSPRHPEGEWGLACLAPALAYGATSGQGAPWSTNRWHKAVPRGHCRELTRSVTCHCWSIPQRSCSLTAPQACVTLQVTAGERARGLPAFVLGSFQSRPQARWLIQNFWVQNWVLRVRLGKNFSLEFGRGKETQRKKERVKKTGRT